VAFTDNVTSLTTNFFNLLPGTTYYFRIRAANGDAFASAFSAIGSTRTLNVPSPTGLSGFALGVSSISWNWSPVSGAQSYNVYPASNTVFPVANRLTADWMETGLSTNTANGVRVTAIVNGVESSLSAATTVYTFAAVPVSAAFSGVTNNQVTLSWLPNGDPVNTLFEVSRSTDNFVLDDSTPIQITSAFINTTTTFTGLASGTTYYFRIRAANGDGFLTDFLGPVSTQTLSDPPTNLKGTAQGVSSITWTWDSVTGASAYNLYIASSPATLIGTINSGTSYDDVNLSTNTAYGRVVTAVNAGGQSALSNSATAYTLAAIPGQGVPSNVSYTSFTVTWSANQNPGATLYDVSFSTDSSFATAVSTPAANFLGTTTSFINLIPSTTYYFHVRAINGDGFDTSFSATLSRRRKVTTCISPLVPRRRL
jgi:fibronectin type 3 domain-containing protein